MIKSPDLEMQLVVEPDIAVSDDAVSDSVTADVEMARCNKAKVNVEARQEQIRSGKSVQPNRFLHTSVFRQKTSIFLKSIDPLFYITCLICSGILFVGTYLFVKHNNQLMLSHLKEIEDGNKELSEQLSRIKSNELTGTPQLKVVSQGQGESMPSVQSQSLYVDEVASAAANDIELLPKLQPVVQPELRPETQLAAQAANTTIDQTRASGFNVTNNHDDEIGRLQYLLDEKRQQLELLALENYELRLAIEFREPIDIDGPDSMESISSNSKISEYNLDNQEAGNQVQVHEEVVAVDVSELINQASIFFKQNKFEDAGKLYLDVLQRSPASRDANLGVASVALVTGNKQLAIDRYRHLLQLYPDDQSVFSLMLDLAATEESLETELQSHAAQLASDQSGLYSMLGHYYGRTGRWVEANDALKASHETSGRSPADILFNLAISYEHLGQVENAVKFYRQALTAADNKGIDRALVQLRLNELKGR